MEGSRTPLPDGGISSLNPYDSKEQVYKSLAQRICFDNGGKAFIRLACICSPTNKNYKLWTKYRNNSLKVSKSGRNSILFNP